MLNILLILAFITIVYSYAYKQLSYNVNLNICKENQKNQDKILEINMNNLPDYTIPKWVYLNVFKYNKKTKLQDKNFYHQFK